MEPKLPPDKMPEAEVSLRLAFFLIEKGHAVSDVKVAIDGAQIRTKKRVHFPIVDFLASQGWNRIEIDDDWRGTYSHPRWEQRIGIHSRPGEGDVVAELRSGAILRVECKKGPLKRSKSSQEYPLIREAVGQLMTAEQVGDKDIVAVAVPSSEKFNELAERWRKAPLIRKCGIRILTVDPENGENGVKGLDLEKR
jgi:hypothetical protein